MIKTALMTVLAISPVIASKIPIYIGSGSEEGVARVLLDSKTGELSGLMSAAKVSAPGSLVMSADRRFVYATSRVKGEKNGFVVSFLRLSDGRLKELNKQSSMGGGACHVSLDRSSKYLFVANYSSGSVASYGVSSTGELSGALSVHQHEGSSVKPGRQAGPHAHSIYSSPDNAFVYVADLGIDKVMIYKLDGDKGTLTPSGSAVVPAGSGPRHMVFSSSGDALYVLNELTLTVSKFSRDKSTGNLNLVATKSVMKDVGEGMSGSEIQLSSDGKFMYAACRDIKGDGRDVISVLNTEGMDIVQEHPAGAWIPRHFCISPSGKWLVVAGLKDNKVVVHSRDVTTGKLAKAGNDLKLKKPMWVLFEPADNS